MPAHTSGVHNSVARDIVPADEQKGLSADQIVKRAMGMVGSKAFENKCQAFVERSAGVNDPAGSAKEAYNRALSSKSINTDINAPAGAQLFFTGNPKWGHTAVSVGGGYMVSTGVNGSAQRLKISDLEKSWGARGKYLGYSTKIGGQGLSGSAQFKDLSGGATTAKQAVIAPKLVASPVTPTSTAKPSTGNIFGRIF